MGVERKYTFALRLNVAIDILLYGFEAAFEVRFLGSFRGLFPRVVLTERT